MAQVDLLDGRGHRQADVAIEYVRGMNIVADVVAGEVDSGARQRRDGSPGRVERRQGDRGSDARRASEKLAPRQSSQSHSPSGNSAGARGAAGIRSTRTSAAKGRPGRRRSRRATQFPAWYRRHRLGGVHCRRGPGLRCRGPLCGAAPRPARPPLTTNAWRRLAASDRYLLAPHSPPLAPHDTATAAAPGLPWSRAAVPGTSCAMPQVPLVWLTTNAWLSKEASV